jgi:tetratricopeptide (TPR) repeat protein
MMRATLIAMLIAAPALADCPPAPDISSEIDAALADLKVAGSEMEARPISNRMWEQWMRAPDGHAQTLLDEGVGRMRLGDVRGAGAAFDALIDYCPDYAEGWNQRAFLAYLTGDFDRALPDLDRALALRPRHVGALSGRGLVLIALGRELEGHDALRAALDLNPWLAERRLLPEARGIDL